jgi:hypothetical protein
MFSQRLPSNDQLLSIGINSPNEKNYSFSHRLNPTTNGHLSQQIKRKSPDISLSSTTIDTNQISHRLNEHLHIESPKPTTSRRSIPSTEQNNQNETNYNSSSRSNDGKQLRSVDSNFSPLASFCFSLFDENKFYTVRKREKSSSGIVSRKKHKDR